MISYEINFICDGPDGDCPQDNITTSVPVAVVDLADAIAQAKAEGWSVLLAAHQGVARVLCPSCEAVRMSQKRLNARA